MIYICKTNRHPMTREPRGRTFAVIRGSIVTVAAMILAAREIESVSVPEPSTTLCLKVRPRRWHTSGEFWRRDGMNKNWSRWCGNSTVLEQRGILSSQFPVYYAFPHILRCPDSTGWVWVKRGSTVFT